MPDHKEQQDEFLPLSGVKVLDFSTLLPGPVCSLLLAESGAEVIKIERPQGGDDMRSYSPKAGDDSSNFVILNRGKKSFAVDLKDPQAIEQLKPFIMEADIVLEQFRPGVMDRLGLGYESLSKLNPRLIYCSITGFGQTGPLANVAAHDLNYVAQTGMLSLVGDATGSPNLPPALIADIAGGAYPAFSNILLALRKRDLTGRGSYIDIAMSENLFTFLYWAIGEKEMTGKSPQISDSLVTGGTPRYQIYRTKDDRFLAAAPLEDKFWNNFCKLIQLERQYQDPACDVQVAKSAVQKIISTKSASEWEKVFEGQDVCCSIVLRLDEALQSPHFIERGVFSKKVAYDASSMMALPVAIANSLRRKEETLDYPRLGANNKEI
jgi:crotonobetainyl-CoA:carnitine CoA-transferase CaiB-like acyl-CoA transferase